MPPLRGEKGAATGHVPLAPPRKGLTATQDREPRYTRSQSALAHSASKAVLNPCLRCGLITRSGRDAGAGTEFDAALAVKVGDDLHRAVQIARMLSMHLDGQHVDGFADVRVVLD